MGEEAAHTFRRSAARTRLFTSEFEERSHPLSKKTR